MCVCVCVCSHADGSIKFWDASSGECNNNKFLIITAISAGNFFAEKQHSNKVLPFGARGSGNYRV